MNKRTAMKWICGEVALLASAGCGAADIGEAEPVATTEQDIDVSRFGGFETVLSSGFFAGPPAVLNVDGNLREIEIYGVGTDGAIWYANLPQWPGSVWSGWYSLGAFGAGQHGQPGATMFHAAGPSTVRPTRKALVAPDRAGNVWIAVTTGTGTPYKPWELIPNGSSAGSAAITFVKPYLFVVIRRQNGMFYWSRNDVSTGLNNARWTGWKKIPDGILLDDPAITTDSNRIVVAGRGTDSRIWITDTLDRGDSWSGWRPVLDEVGRTFRDAPSISYRGTSLEVAARGPTGLVYVATVVTSTGWTSGWNVVGNPGLSLAPTGSNSLGSAADRNPNGSRYGIAGRIQSGQYMFNLHT